MKYKIHISKLYSIKYKNRYSVLSHQWLGTINQHIVILQNTISIIYFFLEIYNIVTSNRHINTTTL